MVITRTGKGVDLESGSLERRSASESTSSATSGPRSPFRSATSGTQESESMSITPVIATKEALLEIFSKLMDKTSSSPDEAAKWREVLELGLQELTGNEYAAVQGVRTGAKPKRKQQDLQDSSTDDDDQEQRVSAQELEYIVNAIPKFTNGQEMDVKKWIAKFTRRTKDLIQEQAQDVFDRCFSPQSKGWKWKEAMEDEADNRSLQEWLDAMEEKFKKTRENIRQRAKNYIQGEHESAEDYMQEKLALVSKLHPGDFDAQLEMILEGVHPKYKRELAAVSWHLDEYKSRPEKAKKVFVRMLDGITRKNSPVKKRQDSSGEENALLVQQGNSKQWNPRQREQVQETSAITMLRMMIEQHQALMSQILEKMRNTTTIVKEAMTRKITETTEETTKTRRRSRCFKCKELGHFAASCSRRSGKSTTAVLVTENERPETSGATSPEDKE